MKQLKLVAVLLVVLVAVVACGGNSRVKSTEKMDAKSDKKMDEKKMDDKKMSDDEKMKDDKEMSDEKMKDDQKMSDKEMMNDQKMDDKKMSDDKKMDDKKMSDSKDHMKMDKVEKMNEGEMAMDFTLMDKDGKEFTLSAENGKKVYAKFWASWCSICLAGLEELNTLAEQENDFEIVTIVSPGVRGEKSKEDFIKWFDTLGYNNIRVLFDEGGEVADSYGVRAFPTSALIGSDGVLVATHPGHMSSEIITSSMAEIK